MWHVKDWCAVKQDLSVECPPSEVRPIGGGTACAKPDRPSSRPTVRNMRSSDELAETIPARDTDDEVSVDSEARIAAALRPASLPVFDIDNFPEAGEQSDHGQVSREPRSWPRLVLRR
jgi:hypothetical protein